MGDHDDEDGSEEAVRVFVRIRPLNKRELAENQVIGWNFTDTSMLEDTPNGQRNYAYDHCFGPTGTNTETYEIVGRPVVLQAMEGYNGTVFTYGQTGSGKTWTMRGSESDPGMMVLCIKDIMHWIQTHPNCQTTLRVSYMEVYNEEINDLLGVPGPTSKNLRIVSEDAVRGAVIGGLVEEVCVTPNDFMEVLHRGEASRSYASTSMNAESSRSHTIYRVSIDVRHVDQDGSNDVSAVRTSYMNLVDLAGSERQKSTNATGKTLKEGSNINKSLLALGAVINKLGEASKKVKGAKSVFIPYRDSKLTRILKQSLGGNTLTSILCTVTPAPMHREETVSTLKFGQLCKTIKNNVKSNEIIDDRALMKQYKATIAELKVQLALYEAGDNVVGRDGEIDSATAQKYREEIESLKRSLYEWEEDEKGSAQAIIDDRMRIEKDRETLQIERTKNIAERNVIDEKEGRVNAIVISLDEKDGKLQRILSQLQSDREKFESSIHDLRKREELVREWTESYSRREERIKQMEIEREEKLNELSDRQLQIAESEKSLSLRQRELQLEEERVTVTLAKLTNDQEKLKVSEQKLRDYEASIRKREGEADIKERELSSRRKELENWDNMLREKDRKVTGDAKSLEEREEVVRLAEEKAKAKEIDADKKLSELKVRESVLQKQMESYKEMTNSLQQQQKELADSNTLNRKKEDDLITKEVELSAWEEKLTEMEERLRGVEEREIELNSRIEHHKRVEDEFFNVKVAQITSRHNNEMVRLENMISLQLKMVTDLQAELNKTRSDLALKHSQSEEFEDLLRQRDNSIDLMRIELQAYQEKMKLQSLNTGANDTELYENIPTGSRASPKSLSKSKNTIYDVDSDDDDDSRISYQRYNDSPSKSTNFLTQLADTQRMIGSILGNTKSLEAAAEYKYIHGSHRKPEKDIEPLTTTEATIHTTTTAKSTSKSPIRSMPDSYTPTSISPLRNMGISIGGKDVSELIQTSQRKGIPVATVNLSLEAKKKLKDLTPVK